IELGLAGGNSTEELPQAVSTQAKHAGRAAVLQVGKRAGYSAVALGNRNRQRIATTESQPSRRKLVVENSSAEHLQFRRFKSARCGEDLRISRGCGSIIF